MKNPLNTRNPASHGVGTWKDYTGPISAALMLDVVENKFGVITRYWVHRFGITRQDRGRTRIGVLGDAVKGLPSMNLTEARDEAVRRQGQAKQKIDPRWGVAGTGKTQKFVEYLDSLIAAETPSGDGTWEDVVNANDRSEWKRTRNLTAKIHNIDLHEVTADHVERALLAYWNAHPIAGNRIRIRLENLFKRAARDKLRQGDNPASLELLSKKNGGRLESDSKLMNKIRVEGGLSENQPALPWERVPAFMARLRADDRRSARAVEFGILSALRSCEIRKIEWPMVDWSKQLLVCPARIMKKRRMHVVLLTDTMVALLKALPGYADGKAKGLIFASDSAKAKPNTAFDGGTLLDTLRSHLVDEDRAHLTNPSEDVTMHGFRSSFRSWADVKHVEEFHILEISIAHVVGGKSEAAYLRDETHDRRRAVMEQWTAYCASGAAVTADAPAGNVVQLRTAA